MLKRIVLNRTACRFLWTSAIVLALAGAPSALGATVNWIGPVSGGNWSTPGNWDNGSVPITNDDAVFPSSMNGATVTLDASVNALHSLTLDGNMAIVPGGVTSLTVSNATAGFITHTNSIGANCAINCNLVFNLATTVGVLGGVPATLTLSGVVSGAGAATFSSISTNTIVLSGNNATYAAAIVVSQGTLQLGNSGALGTAAAGTSVSAGATLDLNGLTFTSAEGLTLAGTGVGGNGALALTARRPCRPRGWAISPPEPTQSAAAATF